MSDRGGETTRRPSVEVMLRLILTQAIEDELVAEDPDAVWTTGNLVGCANLLNDYLAEARKK